MGIQAPAVACRYVYSCHIARYSAGFQGVFRSTAAVDTGNCFGQCDSCDPLHGFQAPSSEHSESLLALLVGLCCCLVSAGCLTSRPMHNVLSTQSLASRGFKRTGVLLSVSATSEGNRAVCERIVPYHQISNGESMPSLRDILAPCMTV